MSLLLCRQKAQTPYCHDKLNINIWSEQELAYCIYNYPLLCVTGFIDERLFEWIEKELRMKTLSDKLRSEIRSKESFDVILVSILRECNYYDIEEVMEFTKKLAEYKKYSICELTHLEAKALFKFGNYNSAFDKLEEAVKLSEQEYRASNHRDDRSLRAHNEKKADMYCDMAAVKMQIFDEKSAVKLLETSLMTCKNERAEKMRYLIDGGGNVSDEVAEELDRTKQEAAKMAVESRAYEDTRAIFDLDKMSLIKEAKKICAVWKKSCRKM